MNAPSLVLIGGKVVEAVVSADRPRCVELVRAAYLAHGAGRTVNPHSSFLLMPDKPSARIIALPAYLGGDEPCAGIKWIASFPENVAQGLPRASAVLILNDDATGYPFAIMEASIVSAARTAASAVLGAEALVGRRACKRLGIVGTGVIARHVYEFLVALGWELGEVSLFDTGAGEAARFRDRVVTAGARHTTDVAPSIDALLSSSDLILFTTIAGKPHVHDPALFSHRPVVLHLSLRDLSPEIVLASQNVVDDVDHAVRANTSLHLTEQRTGGRAFIAGTIADVLTGKVAVDTSRPRVYSPFGLGILDLAVGRWVHDAAVAAGTAVPVADFFPSLER